jgi:hypothetical protein
VRPEPGLIAGDQDDPASTVHGGGGILPWSLMPRALRVGRGVMSMRNMLAEMRQAAEDLRANSARKAPVGRGHPAGRGWRRAGPRPPRAPRHQAGRVVALVAVRPRAEEHPHRPAALELVSVAALVGAARARAHGVASRSRCTA